ncbi:hypothetical protein X975_03876, partial [Stegodyphus mimosarum]
MSFCDFFTNKIRKNPHRYIWIVVTAKYIFKCIRSSISYYHNSLIALSS